MDIKQKLKTLGLTFLLAASSLNGEEQHAEHASPKTKDNTTNITMREEQHTELVSPETENDPTHIAIWDTIEEEKDSEYDYIPKSQKDFLLMAERAIDIINKENPYNTFGQKLISFYDENKDKEINLEDPLIRKSFLAFKKIVKRGHITSSSNNAGTYNETSYLLGIDAKAFNQLNKKANPYMKAFCKQLYNDNSRFKMLDVKDALLAEKYAEQLLADKLNAYHISPQDTTFRYTDFRSVVSTNDVNNEWNDWELNLDIASNQLDGKDGDYCPLAIVKAHELGHIMQMMPGDKESSGSELAELAPTIELIVMQDIIYKKIKGIPLEKEVTYPMSSETGINNGKIANTFREIKEKYNFRSYEDVLLTQEAQKSINMFITQNSSKMMIDHANQNNR